MPQKKGAHEENLVGLYRYRYCDKREGPVSCFAQGAHKLGWVARDLRGRRMGEEFGNEPFSLLHSLALSSDSDMDENVTW